MCINIGVLFGIIRALRVWLDIMVGAACMISKGGRYESSLPGFHNQTV